MDTNKKFYQIKDAINLILLAIYTITSLFVINCLKIDITCIIERSEAKIKNDILVIGYALLIILTIVEYIIFYLNIKEKNSKKIEKIEKNLDIWTFVFFIITAIQILIPEYIQEIMKILTGENGPVLLEAQGYLFIAPTIIANYTTKFILKRKIEKE